MILSISSKSNLLILKCNTQEYKHRDLKRGDIKWKGWEVRIVGEIGIVFSGGFGGLSGDESVSGYGPWWIQVRQNRTWEESRLVETHHQVQGEHGVEIKLLYPTVGFFCKKSVSKN